MRAMCSLIERRREGEREGGRERERERDGGREGERERDGWMEGEREREVGSGRGGLKDRWEDGGGREI